MTENNRPPRKQADGRYRCSTLTCKAVISIAWDDKPEGTYLTWRCNKCGNKGRQFFNYEEFSGVHKNPGSVQ
jgi:hypothetical protein